MKKCCLVALSLAALLASSCSRAPQDVEEKQVLAPPTMVEAVEKSVEPLANPGTWTAEASSQEKDLAAVLVLDGDVATRWASEFADGEWLIVDLQKEEELSTLKLFWEDAFAKKYRILLSSDKQDWTEVFSQTAGKGGEEFISFDQQSARYVKIVCDQRGTIWGNSIREVLLNPQPEAVLEAAATASSGTGDYDPKFAIDGDMSTRWSSGFGDHEWWQLRFDDPQVVAGLKISWETAFSEKYSIQVSDNGQDWKTVYDVPEGDGRTDLLFFEPVETKFVRIACRQRGTGWGNSIHEIVFYDGDEAAKLSATQGGDTAAAAMNGDRETAWHSGAVEAADLIVDLPKVFSVGGVEIGWTEDHARAYTVDITSDGKTWKTVSEVKLGNGGYDYAFFSSASVKQLRIRNTKSATGNGFGIAHLEFKGGEEQATPIREYKAAAKDSPRGWYPWWLLREQEYWNVVGVIDDTQESLLGETGAIEPYKHGFSVLPFILDAGKVFTWADVKLEQKLERSMLPLPTSTWVTDGWNLDVSAVAFGPLDKSSTIARYQLTNKGDAPFSGKLALAVRPVQLSPIWQHGGMSPIYNVKCFVKEHGSYLEINGKPKMMSLTKPSAMGAAPLGNGDVAEYIVKGELPPAQEAEHKDGTTSAGLMYDLEVPAGESREVVVVFLLHDESKLSESLIKDPEQGFAKIWDEQGDAWWDLLNQFSISIPEQRLIDIMKSNLAYILINKDGPWIKPGSRNYAHAWIRDGAMTTVTLLRMGLRDTIKKYIEAYAPLVADNGWCPYIILEDGHPVQFAGDRHEGQEYDSQGQFAFLIRQYYDFTGDQALVEQVYPKVVKAMEFGRARRRMRMTDEYKRPDMKAYYGILPESNSHEGYFPAKHSYWDDFWMLSGYKDSTYLAKKLGHEADAVWMTQEEQDLRRDLLASIFAVMKRDNLDHIPGCVEFGDFDATSTAIAIMACGESDYLPEPYKSRTFDRYYEDVSKGMIPGQERTFTPYEVRSADAFIRLGKRENALAMLRYFTEDSVRPHGWNHFAEVVHARPRAPSYIGDMPHTWVGSGYINAVRSIFAYEHMEKLVICAGIDPAWAGAGIDVDQLPTQYGSLDYRVSDREGAITIEVDGDAAPPKGFDLPLPAVWAEKAVEINGEPATLEDGHILFEKLPAMMVLR